MLMYWAGSSRTDVKEGRNEAVGRPNQRSTPRRNPRSQPGARRREERGRSSEPGLFTFIILLGECSALWASVSEALCMVPVGVYVSSHRKLIGHIGCCRSPQLLAFSAGRAHTG